MIAIRVFGELDVSQIHAGTTSAWPPRIPLRWASPASGGSIRNPFRADASPVEGRLRLMIGVHGYTARQIIPVSAGVTSVRPVGKHALCS